MRHRHAAFFVGCLNCLWLPTCFTCNQPSRLSSMITSRLSNTLSSPFSNTHLLHTYQAPMNEGAELTRRRGVVFGEDRYEVTVNSAIDACGIGLDAFQQIA